jgi:hypothetical protein
MTPGFTEKTQICKEEFSVQFCVPIAIETLYNNISGTQRILSHYDKSHCSEK